MDDQRDSVSGLETEAGLTAGGLHMESKPTSDVPAEPQLGTPPTYRLVIRVKLPPEGQRPAPVRRRLSKGVLLLVSGAAAVLLSWLGISMFRTEPISPMPAPVVSDEPLPKPAAQTVETKSAEVEPVPTEFTTKEVIPDVPRSARETIRGTVRVSVRVIVGKDGAVLAAIADDPGPSRYFERLALEASKKWTFAPADLEEQRIMTVKFSFRRAGTTARANPEY